MLPGQLEMFTTTAASTSVIGLLITMPSACTCGAVEAIVGSSAGPHFASLICAACGDHRGWMSGTAFAFINSIIDAFGRPNEPIIVRNSRHEGI